VNFLTTWSSNGFAIFFRRDRPREQLPNAALENEETDVMSSASHAIIGHQQHKKGNKPFLIFLNVTRLVS
jgi:hypothetical protein